MRLPHKARTCLDRPEASVQSTLNRLRRFRCISTSTVEAVSFWLAVTLPLPTLSLLAFGSGSQTELIAVVGLLAANLLAFVVGHDYSSAERTEPTP